MFTISQNIHRDYQNIWDDRRTSERLLNSEKYYVNNLQKLTKIYLGNLPKLMNEHLQNFIKSTENILSFHYNIFYHSIKRCNSNGGAIFEVFKDKFDEHKFDDYIVHAAYANYAKHLLGNHYMNNSETECLTKTIDNFIFLPMRHIKNYNMLFECMMNEIKVRDNQNDTVSEAFKSGAVAEVKLRHLRKYMQENYNLNSIKGQSNCLVKDWGLVKYSDEVIVEGKCSRLLILEHALCCVKIKTSSKTKEEKFTDQVFLIPLTAVGILEKKPYPKRLIVLPSYAKTRYLIEFTTVNKKNRILAHIPNVKRKYKD